MNGLLLDAALLACPDHEGVSAEELHEAVLNYVSRLADLSRFRTSCTALSMWRTNDLHLLLCESNRYPFRHTLKEVFAECHLGDDEIQLEDVASVAHSLITRSLFIEDHSNIQDLVVGHCVLQNDPMRNRPAPWAAYLCKLVAMTLPGQVDAVRGNVYLASCAPMRDRPAVEVRCTVELIEYRDGTVQESNTPIRFEIENFNTAEGIVRTLDLVALCETATSIALLEACAIHAAIESRDLWSTLTAAKQRLSFGPSFLATARELGFLHTPKKINRLLRVCSDLLHDRNLADGHWLREGDGPNEAQRSRGTWKAWRHDIDHEFHLHYWRDGVRLELANVVVHNDFGITR